jgi:hypothetical protein
MTITAGLSYLRKNRFLPRQLSPNPLPGLGVIVVIPVMAEKELILTLDSLAKCRPPEDPVEVLLVLNHAVDATEDIKSQNHLTIQEVESWRQQSAPSFLPVHLIPAFDLPPKHAGVGLARKIGMDEAVDRLEQAGSADGILVCLDADSRVENDYLRALEIHFRENPKSPACSIRFEHPLSGSDFPSEVYKGIVRYELFLRYYIQGLRFARHPHAYHTIGSSMAVRASAYQAQGGMNRRKAGEDFHFLQKMIPLGHFTECNSCRVIPSPRISDKVPFGTGKAIGDWVAGSGEHYAAYSPESFLDMKSFLKIVPDLYQSELIGKSLPSTVTDFLEQEEFERILPEIRKHVSSKHAFVNRFFRWFNALKALQFVHFCRDRAYPDVAVEEAACKLAGWQFGHQTDVEVSGWLMRYRAWQKASWRI